MLNIFGKEVRSLDLKDFNVLKAKRLIEIEIEINLIVTKIKLKFSN